MKCKSCIITILKSVKPALFVAYLLSMIVSSCDTGFYELDTQYSQIKPKGPRPQWGPTITPQMQAVIEVLDTISPVPLETLTPEQARLQPSPADAAMRLMRNYNILPRPMNVDTIGMKILVQGGEIHVRSYIPRTGKSGYPIILYYHGGGWVIATIDTYNASAQALAEQSDAIVLSVEYRKAPEFKFPTAHQDAFEAYKWALKNASSINGDSTKVAVAGESAGGNLAIAVSMMARDSGIRKPVHQVAVYPIANYDFSTPSYVQYANAKPLNKPLMQWFFMHYLNNATEGTLAWISLVNANLSSLPSTTIIGAEIDPLQTEGRMLADKLMAANIPVVYKLYNGVTHEFFGMASVVPEAKEAQALVVNELWKAFNK